MSSIYLQVPTYVAQFYRGINPAHQLTEFDAVAFSSHSYEYVLLQSALRIADGTFSASPVCFSRREWKNMLQGKPARGGKRILSRSESDWLTMAEVYSLCGNTTNFRTEGYDYLCIECPSTAIVGGRIVTMTDSYTLPFGMATQLTNILRNEFIRILLDWIRQERFWCNQKGIRRLPIYVIDHFFDHYNICAGTNSKERDTMRRMASRWLEESLTLPNDRIDWESEYATFVYSKEKDEQDKDLPQLLKEIKDMVNKL